MPTNNVTLTQDQIDVIKAVIDQHCGPYMDHAFIDHCVYHIGCDLDAMRAPEVDEASVRRAVQRIQGELN